MKSAQKHGRRAFHMTPEKRGTYRKTLQDGIADKAASTSQKLSLLIEVKSREESEITALINNTGVFEETARSKLMMSRLMMLMSLPPIAGEYVFIYQTISFFSLSNISNILVSAGLLIICLEAFDLYLNAFRKKYPEFDNVLFLILGSLSVCIVIVAFLFTSEIRQSLIGASSNINTSPNLEETIKTADRFYQDTSDQFLWLMVSLGLAVAVVSSIYYHLAKSLFFNYSPILRLYNRRNKLRKEMLRAGSHLSMQSSKVSEFLSEFETGMRMEQLKHQRRHLRTESETLQRVMLISLNPFTILIMAIFLFYFFISEANGAEYIILMDTSKSVSIKGYSSSDTEFKNNLSEIKHLIRNYLSPGDNLKLIAIKKNSFSQPYIIINTSISNKSGAFNENLAREKLRVLRELNELKLIPKSKGTDVFGAVMLSSILFSKNSNRKYLVIYSDMRNFTKELDIETPEKLYPGKIILKIENANLIPDLKDVNVFCLGVHSNLKLPAYWLSLRKLFRIYFIDKAKAKKFTFSMERRFSP